MSNEPYSNEHQREIVEKLHTRTKATAVCANSNSNITVYLTRGTLCNYTLDPYEIDKVIPLPDSSCFETKVVLTADWSEVYE